MDTQEGLLGIRNSLCKDVGLGRHKGELEREQGKWRNWEIGMKGRSAGKRLRGGRWLSVKGQDAEERSFQHVLNKRGKAMSGRLGQALRSRPLVDLLRAMRSFPWGLESHPRGSGQAPTLEATTPWEQWEIPKGHLETSQTPPICRGIPGAFKPRFPPPLGSGP